MENLFLGLATKKRKIFTSLERNSLDLAITKQAQNNRFVLKQENAVTNTKFPPASKEWVNSIYSFNPNYTKPLAMVDIMVNRLVKSYFNFVKLIWKKSYKLNSHAKISAVVKNKLKIIKRRKKAEMKKNKLSLNKVFISKGEMKHTNSKVIATFYIFNKTKRVLQYKLSNLYQTFSLLSGHASTSASATLKSKPENKNRNAQDIRKTNNVTSYINKKQSKATNTQSLQGKTLQNSSAGTTMHVKPKLYTNYGSLVSLNSAEKQYKNIYNNLFLVNLAKKRLSRFIHKIDNIDVKNKYISVMKNHFSGISKYKLYSSTTALNNYKDNVYALALNMNLYSTISHEGTVHLSAFYKLLNLNPEHGALNLSRFTKYFKSNKREEKSMGGLALNSNNKSIIHILKTFYNAFALYNSKVEVNKSLESGASPKQPQLALTHTLRKHNNQTSLPITSLTLAIKEKNRKMKSMRLKTIKLINKIRRYRKFIIKSLNLELGTFDHNNVSKRFANYEKNCVRNFLRRTYRKEWLYIRYVKMLLFNNNKYKSSFLLGLKNVVSKLYNKKVEFNFVNLKYIYLNSDVLSKSIAMRLRNRQNRLLTVLNKAVLLVNIPLINNKWEFSPSRLGKGIVSTSFKNNKKLTFVNTISSLSPQGKISQNAGDSLNLLLKNLYLGANPKQVTSNSIESNSLSFTQRNALASVNNKAVFGVRLEAGGRLTKRLTASRSVSKLKYRGSIKNINSSRFGLSSVMLKGNLRSNLQFTKISSKTRNGSFGLKGWVSAY